MSKRPFLVVRAHVNAEILDEFEQWYREVHVHTMLKIPGIVAAFRAESAHGGSNWLTIFKFSSETMVQQAFASKEAEQARRDWERWLPYVSEVTVEVYTPLMALPAYRHWN